MKIGNTRSPWRYDAEAFVAIQPVNRRWPVISRYDLLTEIFRDFEAWSGTLRGLVDIGVVADSCDLRIGGSATAAAPQKPDPVGVAGIVA